MKRKLVREAKGSKATGTLELCARNLLFRPTYAIVSPEDQHNTSVFGNSTGNTQGNGNNSSSSVHNLVCPLLSALVNCVDASMISRISEALLIVAQALAKNPSLRASELLLYLHATLFPYVASLIRDFEREKRSRGQIQSGKRRKGDQVEGEQEIDDDGDDDDLATELPSYLKEESSDEEERALYSKVRTCGEGGHFISFFSSLLASTLIMTSSTIRTETGLQQA